MLSINETQVLRIVRDVKKATKSIISRRLEITPLYASRLLNTLTVKRYLKKTLQGKNGVYTLMPKGKEVLSKKEKITWVGDRERKVLQAIAGFKKASTNMLSRKLNISNDYVHLMCKSLAGQNLRAVYLKEVKPSVYELTPLGEKLVGKKG